MEIHQIRNYPIPPVTVRGQVNLNDWGLFTPNAAGKLITSCALSILLVLFSAKLQNPVLIYGSTILVVITTIIGVGALMKETVSDMNPFGALGG